MSAWRRSLAAANVVANALAAVVIAVTTIAVFRDLACLVIVMGTGVALVILLNLEDLALVLTLVLMVSIVVLICVAQAVTYTAGFSWRPCEVTLLIITGVASLVGLSLAAGSTREPS